MPHPATGESVPDARRPAADGPAADDARWRWRPRGHRTRLPPLRPHAAQPRRTRRRPAPRHPHGRLHDANHLPGNADLEAFGRPLFAETTFDGVGFGLGFSVVLDPVQNRVLGSRRRLLVGRCRQHDLLGRPGRGDRRLFLTQLLPSSTYPIREELKTLVTRRSSTETSNPLGNAEPNRTVSEGRSSGRSGSGGVRTDDDRFTGRGIDERHRLTDRIVARRRHRRRIGGGRCSPGARTTRRRRRGRRRRTGGRPPPCHRLAGHSPAVVQLGMRVAGTTVAPASPVTGVGFRCRHVVGAGLSVGSGSGAGTTSDEDGPAEVGALEHRAVEDAARDLPQPAASVPNGVAGPTSHWRSRRGMISAASPVAVTRPSESMTHWPSPNME